MVKSVRMDEKTGDITTVELQNIKVNTKISETLFKLN
jgi:outer membrane lipoprotein-sorting protein